MHLVQLAEYCSFQYLQVKKYDCQSCSTGMFETVIDKVHTGFTQMLFRREHTALILYTGAGTSFENACKQLCH